MVPVTPEETARALLRRYGRQAQAPDPRRERLLAQVRAAVFAAAREFGAARVFLFGSLAWGDLHEHSDVDLGVEGIPQRVVDGFAARLLWAVDADVQVVVLEDAPRSLRERILREGVLLYDAAAGPSGEPDDPRGDSRDHGNEG